MHLSFTLQQNITPNFTAQKAPGDTELDIMYFSDPHGDINNYRRLKTAADEFRREHKNQKNVDTLILSGGDLKMSTNSNNPLIIKILNLIGLNASALGNHDAAAGDLLADELEKGKPNFLYLAANLIFKGKNKIEELFKQGKLAKSSVLDVNNNHDKYGVIGVAPLNLRDTIYLTPLNDYLHVQDLKNTIDSVREEVKSLESQGINKIIILSHLGYSNPTEEEFYDKELAKIPGVDIIVGGHDHKHLHGLVPDANLILPSEKDSHNKDINHNPVLIVQAGANIKDSGKNLKDFGLLKAVFDSKGVIRPELCENTVKFLKDYPESQEVLNLEKQYVDNTVIGRTEQDYLFRCKTREENPIADLIGDAILHITGARIALVNANAVNSGLEKGNITVNNINQMLPHTDSTLVTTRLTKKEILDALNKGAESTLTKDKPGLIHVAGLKYTVTPEKTVKNVYLVDQDGNEERRLDRPDIKDDEKFTVGYDTFFLEGALGMTMLKKDKDVKHYPDYHKARAVTDYIKQKFGDNPLEIKMGRILIK